MSSFMSWTECTNLIYVKKDALTGGDGIKNKHSERIWKYLGGCKKTVKEDLTFQKSVYHIVNSTRKTPLLLRVKWLEEQCRITIFEGFDQERDSTEERHTDTFSREREKGIKN